MTDPIEKPWEALAQRLDATDASGVEAFLETLSVTEAARAVSRLSAEEQERLLVTLGPEAAADLVEHIPEVQAVEILERLEPGPAAAIIDELPSAEQVDLLGEIEEDVAEAILAQMSPEEAEDVRTLREYPRDVAGGLMLSEYLAYPRAHTVSDVLRDLNEKADEYRDYDVQYAYVTDVDHVLVGVLRLRDLLLARRARTIEELMIRDPHRVRDDTPLEVLSDFFESHSFRAAPVVDARGAIVGVVHEDAIEEELAERDVSDYRKSQGIVGGEELRTLPLLTRSRRRLSWLSVNILLNICAASIIAMFQETLAAVIALAVFLPIISDMSGCSGNQAVAVSIRELTLGLITPRELLRVWGKEVLVGMINGLVLGLLISAVAYLWQGNAYLGLVVGVAMMVNTIVAVSIGGTVPLVLKRLRMDPALASGPILTTVTDMSGFLLVLGLASWMLPRLTAS